MASDADALLRVDAWLLEYEVSMSSSTAIPDTLAAGIIQVGRTLDRTFTGSATLNVRSEGASLSVVKLQLPGPAGPALSTADLQSKLTDLMMRSESMANWIEGGPVIDENASSEEQYAAISRHRDAMMGTAKLDFVRTKEGKDLKDEFGTPYTMRARTTMIGAGKIYPPSGATFEMDGQAGSYLLTLPFIFSDTSTTSVTITSDERVEFAGEDPVESHTTTPSNLEVIGWRHRLIRAEDKLGDLPLIQGHFDAASGKISGEQAFKAEYDDENRSVGTTITVRYTLTPQR